MIQTKVKIAVLTVSAIFIVSTLSGCLVRTYSLVKERVDQDIQGNKGYLQGSGPSTTQQAPKKKTRQVQIVEIEFRSPIEVQKEKESVKIDTTAGNQGYITGQAQVSEPKVMRTPAPQKTFTPAMTTYKVQKGDTLEKIAARKEIYGSYKKWAKIYNANKDKIKNPNKLYVGQVLDIPLE